MSAQIKRILNVLSVGQILYASTDMENTNVLSVGQTLYASTDRENTQRFVCWSDPVC